MRTLWLVFACLTLLDANGADAQVYHGAQVPLPGYPMAQVYVGSPHHASTVGESYARGYADVIRAQGQYNLLASQAMLNLTEAYRRQTENRVAQTEAYFRMRDINRSHRYGDRAARSSDHAVTGRHRATHSGNESGPGSLDLQEGRIPWPEALSDDTFQGYRAVVEQVVNRQATFGAVSEPDQAKVTRASRAMASKLRSRVRECSPEDYQAAKCFLAALCLRLGA